MVVVVVVVVEGMEGLAVAASDNNHLGYSSHAQIHNFYTILHLVISLIRQRCSGDNKIYFAIDVSRDTHKSRKTNEEN